ncbi:MAG: outer membrane protein assembly factor BamD [Sterolibacterium sp.]|nr:outer membrane protein assembly factor BamD [Sterolibacterium sp.]
MRSLAALAAVFAITLAPLPLLSGCGSTSEQADETSGWSAQRIYSEAQEAMGEGAWDKAIKLLEKLESRYPYGRYAQQAQLEVAYANFKLGEPVAAIAACDRFIRLHPNHSNVDYAYYLKGLVNFNEDLGLFGYVSQQDLTERDPKAAREAFDAFKELATKFPNSKYTADATTRMKYLVNALASHEVHVARYYLKRGAYLAAVSRAQEAIKTYPQAPAIEEAMYITVRAYDAIGMKDLRDDAERVMRRNFPESDFYTLGFDRPSPWWKLW